MSGAAEDQLAQLAARQREILARVARGAYVNFDRVSANLQAVAEGRAPDAAAIRAETMFVPFRKFRFGGVPKQDLIKRLRMSAAFYASDLARDVMSRVAFTTQDNVEEAETIILTPADFGYQIMPPIGELLDPARLADWSAQNAQVLPEGRVVDLLPAEAGPHVREQYSDQPEGEKLYVAMERFRDLDDDPSLFVISREDGQLWLKTFWKSYQNEYVLNLWRTDIRMLFRLRAKG